MTKQSITVKSRKIGASYTMAAAAVLWALFGETTVVVSKKEDDAKTFIKLAYKHTQVLRELGSEWALAYPTALELRFENTEGLIKGDSSESAGRGQSGNVILDEFAYHEHPEKVWDAAAPVATLGFKLRVISTPNGVGNRFHELVESSNKPGSAFRLHRVTIDDAIADGFKIDKEACWDTCLRDPRVYSQIHLCSFLDGDQQYIPTDLVTASILTNTRVDVGWCYAGLDIGLHNDLTVLTVVRQTPDGFVWVQEVETCKRTTWDKQMEMIARSNRRWNWRKLCVDKTGLGEVPSEQLQKIYGSHKVEPVHFTAQTKGLLATGLYQVFADGLIYLIDDKDLVQDICSIRRIITDAGNVKYDAARTESGHADRAWSLALAIYACATKPGSRKTSGPGDFANA